MTGLVIGGVVGAGLAVWLAPRAAAEIKAGAARTPQEVEHGAQDVQRYTTDAKTNA